MEALDFEFIKDRGFGELISDYLSLFKKIFKHFNKSIFKFLLPLLAVFLVLFFFASTLGVNLFYNKSYTNFSVIFGLIGAFFFVLFFYFLFISPFGIEYMLLLQEKGSTEFSGKDVWKRVFKHLGKYALFFLASILITLILSIPLALAALILFFIPVIGQITLGVLSTGITIIFICGLFLYLKNRENLFDSFGASFKLLKKKIFIYSLAAYVFRILLTICLGLLTIVPAIIIGFVSFNSINLFNATFFTSFWGKMAISAGGTILILFITISTIYSVTFYTLIYFSSLETTNKEGTLSQIDQIGKLDNEEV